jgi:hypothetical protein
METATRNTSRPDFPDIVRLLPHGSLFSFHFAITLGRYPDGCPGQKTKCIQAPKQTSILRCHPDAQLMPVKILHEHCAT